MAIPKERSTVVRTEDGTRYELPLPEGMYPRDVAGQGELIRGERGIAEAIRQVSHGLRHSMEESRANKVSATFGLCLHPEAGFIVSKGTGGAHFIVTLEFEAERPS